MGAGVGAVGDAVAVHVEITTEVLARLQLLGAHDLAAIVAPGVVPFERIAQARIHADIQIGHHEHRRLQAVGEVQRLRGELEAFFRILGKQQHVLGVAVRGVGGRDDVRLLRARGHAGGRAAALHIDDSHWNLGEVGKPDELAHERDPRTGGGGEGARAVPAGAGDNPDRGELVFGLHDGELVLAARLIHAQPLAVALERLCDRRGRRDRVPGAHRGAAVHRAQRRRAVAFHEDLLAHRVGALHAQADRAVEVGERVVAPHLHRVEVGFEQFFLAFVLLADQLGDRAGVDVEQRGERADVDDVLEQLALARVVVGRVADVGERHAEDIDVVAKLRLRQRPGVVVEEIPSGLDLGEVLVPGLRIHRHHQVHAAAAAEPAALGHPHLVPGGQTLDVGGKDVARAHRHAHPENGPGKQLVGRSRARAVDVGELDDEVIDGLDTFQPHAAASEPANSISTPRCRRPPAFALIASPLRGARRSEKQGPRLRGCARVGAHKARGA